MQEMFNVVLLKGQDYRTQQPIRIIWKTILTLSIKEIEPLLYRLEKIKARLTAIQECPQLPLIDFVTQPRT